MKISGFTIVRNAIIYDFPIKECILSALDLVDEFIVVLGDGDDQTEELIKSITSDKIKIIHSNWETSKYKTGGQVYAHQTDIALKACSGDWCMYLQADEIIHEDSITTIQSACKKHLDNDKVEGFLLQYRHFFGTYNRYVDALHFAYPKEIRIVRNREDIHSWRDAQSFRSIPNFDYKDYWQKEGTRKLNCIDLQADIFHYGWCRDPRLMVSKKAEQSEMHSGEKHETSHINYYDYGNLLLLPIFKGTHPKVMNDKIKKMNWEHLLRYEGKPSKDLRKKFSFKYRIVNFIEKNILGGKMIVGFKNYNKIGNFKKVI